MDDRQLKKHLDIDKTGSKKIAHEKNFMSII